MKKILCLVMVLLITMLSFTAFAETELSGEAGAGVSEPVSIEVAEAPAESGEPQYILVVDNVGYTLPYPLYMENGRTMIEAEALASLIGVEVSSADGFVSFTDGENVATLSLTSPGAVLNDGAVVLDAYAAQSDEVIYVPLRFVAEGFGCTVGFSPVFSEENIFLGAYITVDTNKPANVDFSLMLPDNLSELAANIIEITKTITGISPETVFVKADEYTDAVNAALLAGQKIMFLKDDATAKIEGHKTEDLVSALDSLITEEAAAAFTADEELKAAILDENGAIIALPVELTEEIIYFSVSKTTEDQDAAVYFVSSMNELISSLTAPVE